jgi:hypothetical protein
MQQQITGEPLKLGISNLASRDLFLRQAPPILYHYTTLNGLKGIVESKSLWLTKAAYLNDSSELKLAIHLFQHHAELFANRYSTSHPDYAKLLKKAAFQLDSFRNTNICLASFCEDGDLLSQWRGYTNSGTGVALGFSGIALERINTSGWGMLLRCIYGTEQHVQVIHDLIKALIDSYEVCKKNCSTDKLESVAEDLIGYFSTTFLRVAPVLKNKHFAEEKEWRIVTLPQKITDPKFHSMISNDRVSQYYVYNMQPAESGQHDFLNKMVLGPAPDTELLSDAIWTLCFKQEVGLKSLEYSRIPFRG